MQNIKERKYITIGNPVITNDTFRNILRPLNNYGFKPTGGLWASEYISPYQRISPWYEYLIEEKDIARYIKKYKDLNSASLFTLKEDANILFIDSTKKILELAKKYPSHHHNLNYIEKIEPNNTIFDFEEISKIYDGIYVDFNKIYIEFKSKVFDTWSINTLLLFNLECIKEYQTLKINIDFDDLNPLPYIKEEDISSSKTIKNRSNIYNKIYNYVESIFKEKISSNKNKIFKDYNEYLETLVFYANEALNIATSTQDKEITMLKEKLKEEGLEIEKEIIIRNIVLNYLSNYLYQEKEKIIKLPKSLIKKIKNYSI